MSKQDKRLEKDEKREKEHQAKLLQERINDEKKKKQDAQKTEVNGEETLNADNSKIEEVMVEATITPVTESVATVKSEKVQSCNTCGGAFHDVKTYRDHFK